MSQSVLQAGLTSGLSATSGMHSKDAPKVDSNFDGLRHVLPRDFVPKATDRLTLKGVKGQEVQIPYLSWGAWSWGDTATWHWDEQERPQVKAAWELAVKQGLNWIDTAQAYGSGESERICKELTQGMPRDSFVIQTKWYVVPDSPKNLFTSAPAKYLKQSLERMGLDYVDIYLVHGHIHAQSISSVAKGLKECVDNGWTKAVGVANYSKEDMIQMADELAKYDIPLATNQCEYSILRRLPETSGLLDACKERGIIFQSYSSLAQGRLSGKYSADNEPPKTYRFSSYPMKDLEPTLDALKQIAQARKVPVAAVALNYNISKGVVPVVGFRKPAQVEENAQAFGWRLTNEEVEQLNAVSLEGKSTILWQQG